MSRIGSSAAGGIWTRRPLVPVAMLDGEHPHPDRSYPAQRRIRRCSSGPCVVGHCLRRCRLAAEVLLDQQHRDSGRARSGAVRRGPWTTNRDSAR